MTPLLDVHAYVLIELHEDFLKKAQHEHLNDQTAYLRILDMLQLTLELCSVGEL